MVIDGFKQCGYIHWNWSLDVLHSRLKDTITNREVPASLILEVEEMLIVMEKEQLERPTVEVVDEGAPEDSENEQDDNDVEASDENEIDSDIDIEVDILE